MNKSDKSCRYRGSDEGDDALLLGDGEDAPGEGEVVIGGKESDQAQGKAAEGLGETEAIETGPGAGSYKEFWRRWGFFAGGWRPGGAGGGGHGAWARRAGSFSEPSSRFLLTMKQNGCKAPSRQGGGTAEMAL